MDRDTLVKFGCIVVLVLACIGVIILTHWQLTKFVKTENDRVYGIYKDITASDSECETEQSVSE